MSSNHVHRSELPPSGVVIWRGLDGGEGLILETWVKTEVGVDGEKCFVFDMFSFGVEGGVNRDEGGVDRENTGVCGFTEFARDSLGLTGL